MTEHEAKRTKSCHHDVQTLCKQDVGQARGTAGRHQLIDQASAVVSPNLFIPNGVVIEGCYKNNSHQRGQNLDYFRGIPLKYSMKYDIIGNGAIHVEAVASEEEYL